MTRPKLQIRDLTLRDGQQSLFATRMKQETINRLLPYYEDARFHIMEVWGGAVPDSVMRYLDESPWQRLRTFSEAMDSKSDHPKALLSALSRGRNLFGYVPYPDSVLEGFYKEAIANGLNVMRIFDALNDIDNVKESIRLINRLGGIADGAVCYTVDPKPEAPAETAEPITGPVIAAPMSGRVVSINVKPGQEVKPGDTVLVYEAMKMENDIESEISGIVKRVLVSVDDQVATDTPLIEFEN